FGYPGETIEDITATVQLVRDTLPDDIGISVSYPLPGTKFYNMVKAELGDKHHWTESNDLAMMFRGGYRSPFYRRLHKLLHRDLLLGQRLRHEPENNASIREEMADLEHEWADWLSTEPENRNEEPTRISKKYEQVQAPDLSERWN